MKLDEIIERLKQEDITIHSIGKISSEKIEKASKLLDIELPESFKNYLQNYGALSIKSFEINGITNRTDFEEAVHLNFVGMSLESQKKYGLFKKYIQLGDAGLGDQWVLCCDPKSNNYGKMYYWKVGTVEENDMEKCADSFEKFIESKLLKFIE